MVRKSRMDEDDNDEVGGGSRGGTRCESSVQVFLE